MERRCKPDFVSAIENLEHRMISFRFATLVIMLLLIFDIFLRGFRNNAELMGMNANIGVLPFLQSHNYFMKIVLLGVVYFYSNVPFMEREQLYVLARIGKRKWGRRNLSYIVGSSFFMTILLFVISVVEIVSVGKCSAEWDAVYKTLALTGGNREMMFGISYRIMEAYCPVQLLFGTLLLDWLIIMFLGLVMYVVSLYGYRTASCVLAVILVFLPSVSEWLTIDSLVYYSPVSWLDCDNWRIGFDNTKPDMAYMLIASLFLIFLLMLLC